MEEQIKIIANDTVAIIANRYYRGNNTYDVIPTDVAIGRIDENGLFNSEDHKFVVGDLLSDYILCNDMNQYYLKAINISELKSKYPEVKDLSNLLIEYLDDIRNQIMLVSKDEQGYHLFSKPCTVIKEEQKENCIKELKPIHCVPQIIKKIESKIPEPIKIDLLDFDRYLKHRILENDEVLENIETTIAQNLAATNPLDIQSILSIGTTGSGKTSTYKAMAEYLGVPLMIYDCTSLTAPGYKGKDIDDILRQLYKDCKDDLRLINRGIIMLDEFDKISAHGTQVNDMDVQNTLLKLYEGYKYSFQLEPNMGKSINLDTSFMTRTACGAFEDLLEKLLNPKSIGFNNEQEKIDVTDMSFLKKELVKYGYLKELIGRIKNVYFYKKLDHEGLRNVILNGLNSPLIRKIERCENEYGCIVEYDDEFIDALVEYTMLQDSGARSLDDTVSLIFKRIDRELYLNHGVGKKLLLTPEIIYNYRSFEL